MKIMNFLSRYKFLIIAFLVSFGAAGVSVAYLLSQNESTTQTMYQSGTQDSSVAQNGLNNDMYQNVVVPSESVLQSTSDETKSQLLYLIEEEKLAHDVYQKMYDLYGARIFSNITKSEAGHQSRVLALLEARDITDPRSSQVGVFADQSLQKLYAELIAQGSQSLEEAYKVGVAIEEMDIADIKQDLKTLDPSQTDIETVLEALLQGSENHLRAFNRQVR